MRFMNEYAITSALHRWIDHPVLGPATQSLENLKTWANRNSDGWAYWPKPARSAAKLMELIERADLCNRDHAEPTAAEYRKALAPIKAFRTRQGADFEVIEVKD